MAALSGPPLSPVVRRAFAWSATGPLGAFLVVHVVVNSFAVRGPEAFERVTSALRVNPLARLAEVLLVAVPLAFHVALGAWIAVTGRQVVEPSPYPSAVRVAMRVTGVGVLAFLALHVAELGWRPLGAARLGPAELGTVLDRILSATSRGFPLRGTAYLLGAACAAFHFGAGVWGQLARARRATSAVWRARSAWIIGGVAACLWLGFANVVVLRATGAALIGEARVPASAPCPAIPAPPPPR